jgi:hypothetical protein
MAELLGPDTLRALAMGLQEPALPHAREGIIAHADAWEAERVDRIALAEQLAEVQKQVEVLEADRKWWQANAIKRAKRSAKRRSGHSPQSTDRA